MYLTVKCNIELFSIVFHSLSHAYRGSRKRFIHKTRKRYTVKQLEDLVGSEPFDMICKAGFAKVCKPRLFLYLPIFTSLSISTFGLDFSLKIETEVILNENQFEGFLSFLYV